MGSVKRQERKLLEIRSQVERTKTPLALTESHFTMRGRNRCDLNSAWATGVAYARFLNLHQRHGDLLKIANLGDFCGTRWQTNVIMIPTHGGKSYIMPVGKVMALYTKHTGRQAVRVTHTASELDIVASRTEGQFFLHVVNTHRTRAHSCRLAIDGHTIESGIAYEIATDPTAEITSFEDDPMKVREKPLALSEAISFPPASVTALVLTTRTA